MGEEFHVALHGGAPWGFRLQGGKEFRSPLRIAKVEPTGKAGRAEIKVGDHVTMINGVATTELYHTEALATVKRAGGSLQLDLFRPEGDGPGANGLAPLSRSSGSLSVNTRNVISSSGNLGERISISPTPESHPVESSQLSNGQPSILERNTRNTFSTSRGFDDNHEDRANTIDNSQYYQNSRDQWSPDVINAAVSTPAQITMQKDYGNRQQQYSTSSSEDRDDSSAAINARSSTLPRRPPSNLSAPPRRLDANTRSMTMPRKPGSANRTPDWYKQMYKEMHSSMEVGTSHLGVLLASDAAKGAFRSYDGATSPGRSQSPDTAPDHGRSAEYPPHRRTSETSVEFRSNRSSATLPNRKSMPNINPADIPRPTSTSSAKSLWYKEMQRGGEIPVSGLKVKVPPPTAERKVFLYNDATKEIKPANQARVSRPPPKTAEPPKSYEYNDPPDFLDLRRREEATGVRQKDIEQDMQLGEEAWRKQRERELEEQAQVELLRQQEEQEFEQERQAEVERKRLEREQRRREEEHRVAEEKRRQMEEEKRRAEEDKRSREIARGEEENQRKIQEQRRREEVERREAKRLLEEQRQHEEQRRLNEKKRQDEERRREDERRVREEEERRKNRERQEDERRREEQQRQEDLRRAEEENRQTEMRIQEEIRRKEEEERLQEEELKRIESIEQSMHQTDEQEPSQEQLAKALYSFRPQSDTELTFRKGDIIKIIGMVDDNWCEGELNGTLGIFPVTYVEMLEQPKPEPPQVEVEEGLAKAKYNFKAESPKELPFKKNDMIVLLRRIDDNWYEGEVNDKIGIFPLAYVDIINEPRIVERASSSSQSNHVSEQSEIITSAVEQVNYSAPDMQFDIDEISLPQMHNEPEVQQGERHRAKFGYRPMNQDELELREGDTIFVLEKCDDGWFVGTCERSGLFGTFPGNYVVPL